VIALVTGCCCKRPHKTVVRGTLTGSILSGTQTVPPGGSAVLFTAPRAGVTVLTQVCFTHSGDNRCVWGRVEGSSLGTIAGTDCAAATEAGSNCLRFDTGLVLPPGERLTCIGFKGGSGGFGPMPVVCSASAVVSEW
jgi:hypothetical protein